jgi:hypothetical protein
MEIVPDTQRKSCRGMLFLWVSGRAALVEKTRRYRSFVAI